MECVWGGEEEVKKKGHSDRKLRAEDEMKKKKGGGGVFGAKLRSIVAFSLLCSVQSSFLSAPVDSFLCDSLLCQTLTVLILPMDEVGGGGDDKWSSSNLWPLP